jgi:hypothetical protein
MEKLNILVLHKLGDPRKWRTAVRDLEFMLPTNAPEHNYIVHATEIPLPDFVKEISFDGIILGPTFLCDRYSPRKFSKTLNKYDFIRTSDAFKIALPQDDYDCSAILDQWMVDWKTDLVYTVCPEYWPVLYPTFLPKNKIKLGYTSYISDYWIDYWQEPKPFAERRIDVSYRAGKLPPNFGRIGKTKGTIGDTFKSKISDFNLNVCLDISTDYNDFIAGSQWHEFMENSKFCLGSNSGSSLLDPYGEIRRKVEYFLSIKPTASFEDVEDECFPGEDGKYIFTAISPRNIEAALAKTVQITVPGEYSGILKSELDYVPIEADGSNISDVVGIMRDERKVQKIAEHCKESILSVDGLRSKNQTNEMINMICDHVCMKKIQGPSQKEMEKYINRYKEEANEETYWRSKRHLDVVKNLAIQLGARRLRRFIGF